MGLMIVLSLVGLAAVAAAAYGAYHLGITTTSAKYAEHNMPNQGPFRPGHSVAQPTFDDIVQYGSRLRLKMAVAFVVVAVTFLALGIIFTHAGMAGGDEPSPEVERVVETIQVPETDLTYLVGLQAAANQYGEYRYDEVFKRAAKSADTVDVMNAVGDELAWHHDFLSSYFAVRDDPSDSDYLLVMLDDVSQRENQEALWGLMSYVWPVSDAVMRRVIRRSLQEPAEPRARLTIATWSNADQIEFTNHFWEAISNESNSVLKLHRMSVLLSNSYMTNAFSVQARRQNVAEWLHRYDAPGSADLDSFMRDLFASRNEPTDVPLLLERIRISQRENVRATCLGSLTSRNPENIGIIDQVVALARRTEQSGNDDISETALHVLHNWEERRPAGLESVVRREATAAQQLIVFQRLSEVLESDAYAEAFEVTCNRIAPNTLIGEYERAEAGSAILASAEGMLPLYFSTRNKPEDRSVLVSTLSSTISQEVRRGVTTALSDDTQVNYDTFMAVLRLTISDRGTTRLENEFGVAAEESEAIRSNAVSEAAESILRTWYTRDPQSLFGVSMQRNQ